MEYENVICHFQALLVKISHVWPSMFFPILCNWEGDNHGDLRSYSLKVAGPPYPEFPEWSHGGEVCLVALIPTIIPWKNKKYLIIFGYTYAIYFICIYISILSYLSKFYYSNRLPNGVHSVCLQLSLFCLHMCNTVYRILG